MAALFFPTNSVLRLVLASGLVPPELSHAPTDASHDEHGRLWLELAELPAREVLAALARVGVQVQSGTGVAKTRIRSWAELLELRPLASPTTGTSLFIGPARAAPRFIARIRRFSSGPIGFSLQDDNTTRTAWITCRKASPLLLSEKAEAGSTFESFAEQLPGIWVQHGWEHPLPQLLTIPPESFLLIRPPYQVSAERGPLPTTELDEFSVSIVKKSRPSLASPTVTVPIKLQLISDGSATGREALWILTEEKAKEFWNVCAGVDERLLGRLQVGYQFQGEHKRLVVFNPHSHRPPPFLPLSTPGYVVDARSPGLFLPSHQRIRPAIRPRELSALLGLDAQRIVWVEPSADESLLVQSLALADFKPLSKLMSYTSPRVVDLKVSTRADPFPLIRLIVQSGVPQTTELETPISIADAEEEPAPLERSSGQSGWLVRSLRKLVSRFAQEKPAEIASNPAPQESPSFTGRRVEQSLASSEALRHGPDWASRRRELETSLFQELPRLSTERRAGRWAALANVYTKLGNPSDAALCWLNATWESPGTPVPLLKHWLRAECQAAKLTEAQCLLDRWLSERQPGIARVVAAYCAVAGHTHPPTEFLANLPRILTFLDHHCDDLPVRATWLARLAIARVCDGDALGLARCRDRLLSRLAEQGPGLDLDEPSFLRFHGNVSGERFQSARKWLESIREKVHDWIQRHARPNGRLPTDRQIQSDRLLQWAGLVAEREATTAYADFMLAWGLACLGERTQANNWAAQARKRLSGTTMPGVDPTAHAVLSDLFSHRLKDAQEGRLPKASLPYGLQSRIDALPELARYAVDRLREHSQILEPRDLVRAFRGRDLKDFWGSDRLGERLSLVAERTDPLQLLDETDALLQICAATPSTETVPRVVLTLLEIAPRLDQALQLRILDQLPLAIEWLEAWLATGRWSQAELNDRARRYRTRMITAGFAIAASLEPVLVSSVIGQILHQLRSLGDPIRQPLLNVAAKVFRTLRRLGLKSDAESLVVFLDPEGERNGRTSAQTLLNRLALSIGWFTSGHEDAGYRTLTEAGELLYLTGDLNLDERTKLAIAYAETLGFAPPGIAQGRLGEIFTRLDRIKETGSTNPWFTLKPLQLIDIVVRSVVTDEFALGPSVRGWLDDDEFLMRGRIHRDLAVMLHDQGIE